MPIKFPKFSRRKSTGNALQAGYEPANPDNQFTPSQEADEGSRASAYEGGYTGVRYQDRVRHDNRGSGQTNSSKYFGSEYYASTGSSNRLSSSSTLPSADTPRTPDDHRNQPSSLYSTKKSPKSIGASSGKRSFGGSHGPTSPGRKGSMSASIPPRLDTALDTSSLFGNDMFSFTTSKATSARPTSSGGVGHTAPKLASSSIINTSDNHNDITPVPPPKSYNPSTSPTTSRFSYAAYNNIYASPSHMDGDRPGATEYSPYGWRTKDSGEMVAPTMPAASNSSPRNSRSLTPGQSIPVPSHAHSDSLPTPTARLPRLPRQHPSRGGSGDSVGLKRTSAVMRRQSFPEDEDAALVAHSVASHKNQLSQSDRRPHAQTSNSAPLVGSAKGLTDKVKDRDSGWDEGVVSGSSSVNSYPGNSSSSSHDTRGTNQVVLKGNADVGFGQADTTPRAKRPGAGYSVQLRDGDDIDFDASISASAALAARYEETEPEKPQQNKIMTPAQFERYRQQQDEQRRLSGNKLDNDEYEGSESSESEEESEAERNRVALKQRQKQEAHLSVYRQQMMKITGSQPAEQPLGMNSRMASVSTSALPLNTSMPQLSLSGPGSSGKSSEEEDEEIPLGILMAHGFPNKNRPPTRLSNASSQPNLRAAAQNQQDPRLPPFARNLPQDPYNVGASLINSTNRMSLAFGAGGDTRSLAGGSMYNGMPPSEMPGPRRPGGLIGEIMRTEEAKAARKGGASLSFPPQRDPFRPDPFRPVSPGGGMLGLGGGLQYNSGGVGGGAGQGNGMGQGMGQGMGMGGNMGMGGMPPMGMMGQGPGGQGDAMQAQMASQMQQMMNIQMQWMQLQMQQGQQQQQMLMPPMMGQRPVSMAGPSSTGAFSMAGPHQRTMSMMEPPHTFVQQTPYASSIIPGQRGSLGGGLQVPGYTPSIAPSERSTVGLPSRYRPVSYHPGAVVPNGTRAATLTSGIGHDWNKKSLGPSQLKNSGDSDEDDETGWEELEKKRKEKKDGWRKKKESGLKGMLNFGSSSTS